MKSAQDTLTLCPIIKKKKDHYYSFKIYFNYHFLKTAFIHKKYTNINCVVNFKN